MAGTQKGYSSKLSTASRCNRTAFSNERLITGAYGFGFVRLTGAEVNSRNQNGHRSVHQNYGRVLRNNASPEIEPSQVPARVRMCSIRASRAAGTSRTWLAAARRRTAVGCVLATRVLARNFRARSACSRMFNVSVIRRK
jgi:hypothetical protein